MTPIQIMQNPNFWIVAPIAMLQAQIPLDAFLKPDEEGNLTEDHYTVEEFVKAGGHTVSRFNNDGSKFIKGFCFTMDTANELIEMLPSYGLEYKVDAKLINKLQYPDELALDEWKTIEK